LPELFKPSVFSPCKFATLFLVYPFYPDVHVRFTSSLSPQVKRRPSFLDTSFRGRRPLFQAQSMNKGVGTPPPFPSSVPSNPVAPPFSSAGSPRVPSFFFHLHTKRGNRFPFPQAAKGFRVPFFPLTFPKSRLPDQSVVRSGFSLPPLVLLPFLSKSEKGMIFFSPSHNSL